MSIESIIVGIVATILGGGVGYLIKFIVSKFEVAKINSKLKEEQQKAETAEKARLEMVKQVGEVVQKYEETRALLNDAVSALTVLKAYEAIDKKTKEKIAELENSFEEGKVSDNSKDVFKKMLEEINKKNEEYNKGRSESTSEGENK